MPRIAKELSALDVKRLRIPGKYAVGNVAGLMLVVKDSGTRSWILRVIVGGRRRAIGLGPYPEVSLAEALNRAREAKKQIRVGIDPVEERKKQRRALIERPDIMTFKQAAKLTYEKKSVEFRNSRHSRQWISSIEQYANPIIGDMGVDEIGLSDILRVLEPIWVERTETASRLRQRIENVFSWAIVSGFRQTDNPARWRSHLDAVLPKPGKIKRVNHLPALPWREIGSFMAALRKQNGMAVRALEFAILTAARSGEIRLATWPEMDLKARIWTIPDERMKTGREHRVPLSDDAVRILESLPRFEGVELVFPGRGGRPLSDASISTLCRRMQIDAVPHGFRSTFRDWCAESTNFPREVAEAALAHVLQNKSEAAYFRSDLFEKRRKLMEAWADYCGRVQGERAGVTPIRSIG